MHLENTYADNILTLPRDLSWAQTRAPVFLTRRWLYHILFWLAYYLLFTIVVIFGIYQVRDLTFYLELIPVYILDVSLIYFNFYVLMPHLLARRKYFYYAVCLGLSVVCTACLIVLLKQVYAYWGSALYAATAKFNFSNVIAAVIERFYSVVLTTFIKIAKGWFLNQQKVKEKEKQLLEAELNFLKSQIQPHFFFNTLNNLYSLTLKKADLAPEVVLKLSDLMSYMLYETIAPKVSLNKEITYLENYIDLEKLRFGNNLTVLFTIEGETDGIYLPPLVLILFVENCFKHGARDNANKLQIEIDIKVENGSLFFKVKNPVAESTATKNSEGIGLKNARRRLQLLYGDNYSLEETKKGKEYLVSLKIPV